MSDTQKFKYDILVGALVERVVNVETGKTMLVWDEFHHIRFSLAAHSFDEADEFALLRLEQVLGAPRTEWNGKTWALKSVTLDGDVQIVPKPSGIMVPS